MMAEDFHFSCQKKVCICGKKAARELKPVEIAKFNESREESEKVNFDRRCFPVGVCKKCIISIRTKRAFSIGLWEQHATAGLQMKKTEESTNYTFECHSYI